MSVQVDPAVHGAFDFAELERLGLDPDAVLDFSVNSNPFGPAPLVREAIRSTPLERYPDRESIALRRALSKQLDVLPEQILAGNGAAELIQLTAFACLQQGEHALVVGPTFGEYERCIWLAGGILHHWRAVPENGFIPDLEEIEKTLTARKMRLAFICNPNNPTGQVIPLQAVEKWSRTFPDTLFVVDEAYLAFVPGMYSVVSLHRKNILILRSMTKDYALAGLRLGYAVGDENVIAALADLRPAWNVNALAQAAGLAALQDETCLSDGLRKLQSEKEALVSGLKELGYEPVPSQTHYFLLPVEEGARFRRKLLKKGILVRDCASFGLPSFIRIATRTSEENARLLHAMGEMRS
ncbi:MAG: histidinol-phosphate aminotransferase family protein [Anaerolineales bacterium]|nr:histidinol-phosphate aminotransferase family protein [Anaerolineales bacterium]